jgi:hypothetical protein
MFFRALVTLGIVILEPNPQKKLESSEADQRPTDARDVASNTQKETVFLLFLLVYMGKIFRVCMFG